MHSQDCRMRRDRETKVKNVGVVGVGAKSGCATEARRGWAGRHMIAATFCLLTCCVSENTLAHARDSILLSQPDEDSVLVTTFGDRNYGWVDFPEEDVVGFGLHMEFLAQKITDPALDPDRKFEKALLDAKKCAGHTLLFTSVSFSVFAVFNQCPRAVAIFFVASSPRSSSSSCASSNVLSSRDVRGHSSGSVGSGQILELTPSRAAAKPQLSLPSRRAADCSVRSHRVSGTSGGRRSRRMERQRAGWARGGWTQ
eukprot:1696739-Rhodomonas_salina.3